MAVRTAGSMFLKAAVMRTPSTRSSTLLIVIVDSQKPRWYIGSGKRARHSVPMASIWPMSNGSRPVWPPFQVNSRPSSVTSIMRPTKLEAVLSPFLGFLRNSSRRLASTGENVMLAWSCDSSWASILAALAAPPRTADTPSSTLATTERMRLMPTRSKMSRQKALGRETASLPWLALSVRSALTSAPSAVELTKRTNCRSTTTRTRPTFLRFSSSSSKVLTA